MLGSVAQAQPEQAQAATGIVLVAVTGTVGQSQDRQTQAVAAVEAMLATVAQAQAGQSQAATGAEAMLGSVAQEQAPQQQAALGMVLVAVTGQVAQAQALQGQQATGGVVVAAVPSGGGMGFRISRRGKPIYITIPGGKRKKLVKVEVKAIPKAPEEDRRHVLEALRRLSSIRLQPTPAPKIDRASIRPAVHAAFSISGSVAQSQAPALQRATAKESRPDEEMLLLLIA
jgi:hypothetical protein